MKKIEYIINKYIQDQFTNNNEHIFIKSFKWFKKYFDIYDAKEFENLDPEYFPYEWDENEEINIKSLKKIDYKPNDLNNLKFTSKCNYQTNKVISPKQINKLYKNISDSKLQFQDILNLLRKIYHKNIPSSITNKQFHNKHNKDAINVLIVGGGPIGLFTALYLDHYYKIQRNEAINVLLIDNRIKCESIRKPFTRRSKFGYHLNHIIAFLPRIMCWLNNLDIENFDDRNFGFIHELEYLLYLVAFNREIKMYFTKQYNSFDKITNFAKNHNYQYLFDCTGGRLKARFKMNLKWKNIESFTNYGRYSLKLKDGYYKAYLNDKPYEHYTILLKLYDKNGNIIPTGNIFCTYYTLDDLNLVLKYKNHCMTLKQYLYLAQNFKSAELRYLINITLLFGYNCNNLNIVSYIELSTFISQSKHIRQPAKYLGDNLLYVAMGDTLGSSEYGIHFGMKKEMEISEQICNSLILNKYLV